MITCIGGRNGSGKSAIMIALGILFGQRAQALERGNSYKNLIKTGCNQAVIRVTITNYRKYKYEKYGDEITIEKKLRDNGSKITIYNKTGKIFNITRAEMNNIMEEYKLKFDNPLNFLTQEQSKKFLNISKPELLYDFYYKGTEFKDINEEIAESIDRVDDMKQKLQETTNELENILVELEAQEDNLKFLEKDYNAELVHLEKEEGWAALNIKREELKKLDLEIQRDESKIFNIEEQKKVLNRSSEAAFEEVCVKNLVKNIEDLSLQHRSINNDYEEYKIDYSKKLDEFTRIKEKCNIKILESELEIINKDYEFEKLQFCDFEEEKIGLEILYEKEKAQNEEISQKKFNYKKQIEYLKENVHDAHTQTLIKQFKLVESELKKGIFKDTVIGPVCNFIKLKEPKWYKVASVVLKNSLENYIVFNKQDKISLFNLFKRLNVNFKISQMSSKNIVNNLNKTKKYKTLLDVLEFHEDIILNQLVTFHNVEQIILLEDRETAYSVIKENPTNVQSAYTLQADRIKMINNSLSDFRSKDDGKFWFEDKTHKIQHLERQITNLNTTNSIKDMLLKVNNDLSISKQNIDQMEIKKQEIEIKLSALRDLKENDTEGLERKIGILEKNMNCLKVKKDAIELKLIEQNNSKRLIENKNTENRKIFIENREAIKSQITKLECDAMIFESQKGGKIQQIRELKTMIENVIAVLGDEIENPRYLNEIEKDKRIVKEQIKIAKNMDSKEDLINIIRKLKIEKNQNENILYKFKRGIEDINECCLKRIEKRDEIKDIKTLEAAELFKMYTMKNGYEGQLIFNHENRQLDLKMRVHNSELFGSKSTLSGGERSFAGVCFLLCLWKSFRCPIKILDEFDVFMDSLNRKMAIRSLIDFFKENDMQVILITPLNTNDLVDDACEIRVLKKLDEE